MRVDDEDGGKCHREGHGEGWSDRGRQTEVEADLLWRPLKGGTERRRLISN